MQKEIKQLVILITLGKGLLLKAKDKSNKELAKTILLTSNKQEAKKVPK